MAGEIEPRDETGTIGDATDFDAQRQRQDILLKRTFAVVGLVLLVVELGLATLVFWRYGDALRWQIPDAVISAYLGATVVQVVGIVLVMTRSLFRSDAG